MNSVTLHASPSQRRCGVVVRAKGALQLTAVVLPKPWRPDKDESDPPLSVEWSQPRLHIAMYEGQRIRIEFAAGDMRAEDRREIAEGLASAIPASTNFASEQEQVLFALSPPTTRGKSQIPQDSIDLNSIVDLFRLCELAAFDPLKRSVGDLGALPVESAWLLAYLQARFNRSTADALRHVRRGYVERRERLSTMRGRPRGDSLALALVTGEAVVECDFEEFEYSTPLLRTIAACLDAVIRTPPCEDIALRTRMEANRRDAAALRIQLAEVRSFESASAMLFVSRHRLSRLERPWTEAFRLAPAMLRRRAVLGQSDAVTALSAELVGTDCAHDALRIEIDTANIWERLLRQSAKRIGWDLTASCDRPWDNGASQSNPKPDIAFAWPRSAKPEPIILDAKYKFFAEKPSAEDAYQMFAYSHLAQVGEQRARRLFLAYIAPAKGGRDYERYWRLPRIQLADSSRGDTLLGLLPLPWPARDCLDAGDRYLAKLDAALDGFLRKLN